METIALAFALKSRVVISSRLMKNQILSAKILGVLATFLPAALMAQTSEAGKTPAAGRTALYAAAGAELMQYDLDRDNAALLKRGSVTLPANIQEAWPHPSRKPRGS